MTVKEGNYIVIQAFMRNELNLKGNELLAYAVIYGFTQNGEDWFTGSRSYLSDWLGVSKKTVTNVLQSLTENGLIERRETVRNEVTFVDYRATSLVGKNFPRGREKTSPHNIDNNNLCKSGIDKAISEEVNNVNLPELEYPKWTPTPFDDLEEPSFAIQCLKVFNDVTGWELYNMPQKATECLNLREPRYTLEQVREMIKMKRDDWIGTKVEKFLKPSTLFSPDHFDEYMQEYLHQNDEREFTDDEIPY